MIGAIKGGRSSRSEQLLRPALHPRSQSSLPIRASQLGPTRHVTALLRAGKACGGIASRQAVSSIHVRSILFFYFFYKAKYRVEYNFFF